MTQRRYENNNQRNSTNRNRNNYQRSGTNRIQNNNQRSSRNRNQTKIKKFFSKRFGYIFAFLAGFIAMFAIFLPAAYVENQIIEGYVWMWALYSSKILGGDWEYGWLDNNSETMLIFGLIAFLLIVIATITLLHTVYKVYKAYKMRMKYRDYSSIWIICGVLLFVAPIMYLIATTGEDVPFGIPQEFWSLLESHYAIIGPFFAGVIAIVAGYVDKRYLNKFRRY